MMKGRGALLVVLLVVTGCGSRVVTNTPRSAIEQMLLTGAVDRALRKFYLSEIVANKVYVDFSNLKAYDAEYIRVATRARFAQIGAILVDKPDEADFIAEVASGGLGTEFKSALVGLPPIPIPNSPLPAPEVSVFKGVEQTGILKLLIFIHKQGRFVSANHYYAKCDRQEGFVLWWRFQHRDQIREGWEKAELDLRSRSTVPKAQ